MKRTRKNIVYLGCDHTGYYTKEEIFHNLPNPWIPIDCGTNSVESCHYSFYAQRVCDILIFAQQYVGMSTWLFLPEVIMMQIY